MIEKFKSKLNSDSNLKELLQGSAITFALKMLGMFLGYVVVYLISKKNGADGVGYYSLINQFLLILGVISVLGTNTSVLRLVGQYNNSDDAPQMHTLYRRILGIIVPLSIALGIFVFFFAPSIAQYIFKSLTYTEGIRIVGLALPFFALYTVGIEFIRGLKKLQISEFIRSVSRPLVLITCLLLFWNDTIPVIYIIYFIGFAVALNALLSTGSVLFFLNKIKRPDTPKLSTQELVKVSSPMMVTAVSAILMSTLSLFFIEFYCTTEDVGIYSVALRLAQLISIALIVVNTISAPKFSELFWAKKKQELQKIIRQSVKLIFWSSLALSAIVIFGSEWILGVFGKEFEAGQLTLIILVLGQLFNAATGSVGLFLNMSGNQKILRNTALIALLVQCVLAVILIPSMDILGAAIAATAAGMLWNILCTFHVSRKMNFKTYYFPFITGRKHMNSNK
ncbi:MAG: flippase [Crocinitomicaceae bacterium]|nr:flippase [Crocinitomicaceae bacterium]